MQISSIQSFLVQPGKGIKIPPVVSGTEIPKSNRVFYMLSEVFNGADQECDIPIRFLMAEDGSQENEVHSMLVAFTENPDQEHGLPIAERLRDFTTGRSKLGLLFLMVGSDNGKHKLVVSRFPAEIGILADTDKSSLKVEFIERIFMKNATLYKAAVYNGSSPKAHFWSGHAIDKQVSYADYDLAQYWIQHFLKSDYKTTSKAGSKRVALAIREASKSAKDLSVKRELAGVGMLIGGFAGSTVTLQKLMSDFGLSEAAMAEITKHLSYPALKDSSFVLDVDEFQKYAAYSSVELDNGSLLLAPSDRFETCFEREVIDEAEHRFRFSTQGQVIDERVRGRR